MANIGKYVDRNPNLRAAGIIATIEEGAGDALRIYNKEECAENLIRVKCKKAQWARKYRQRDPFISESNLSDILSPELQKSRFVAFREKFSEDLYFKRPEVGKVYALHLKPDAISNDNTTFGDKLFRSDSAYEVVLPKKSPEQVNREYIRWHDKYVISHNHYLPAERINRGYVQPSFNPNITFGMRNDVDTSGANVKKCLSQCEKVVVISKAQKNFLERSMGRLGKNVSRYKNELPENYTFGGPFKRDKCDVQSLLENINPCTSKHVVIDALSHINKWRHMLFKRPHFHAHDLKSALKKLDNENTGYLPISKLCAAAHSILIRLDEKKIRIALRHFNLIENECSEMERVFYDNFWKLLAIQYPLPLTGNLSKLPDVVYNKETTYRELCKDMNKKPIEAPPLKHIYEPKTTAKDLVEPDIPMHFGLDPRDFAAPRPKEELRQIFKRLLTDKFDEVWDRAKEQYKPALHDLLSVDELRSVMNTSDTVDR